TLLAMVSERTAKRVMPMPGAVWVVENRKELRSRIRSIVDFRGKRSRWAMAAAALVLIVVALVGLTRAPERKLAAESVQKNGFLGEAKAIESVKHVDVDEEMVTEPHLSGEEVPMVAVSARVWKVVDGEPDELIAAPLTLVANRRTADFENVLEIPVPGHYRPPSLPKEIADRAIGGGVTKSAESSQPPWVSNDVGAVIPPFPSDWKQVKCGLQIQVAPTVATDGRIALHYRIVFSALLGYENIGEPVRVNRTRKWFGGEEEVLVSENRQLMPVFRSMVREDTVWVDEKAEIELKGLNKQDWKPDLPTDNDFAETLVSDLVSTLRVDLAAEVMPEEMSKAEVSQLEDQEVFLTANFIELDQPIPDPISFGGKTQEVSLEKPPVILSDPQFQVLIRALNQQQGVDLLSAPSLLLKNGSTGRVEVGREFVSPTEFDPPTESPITDGEVTGFRLAPATPSGFQSRNVGITLDARVQLFDDDSIGLEIHSKSVEFRDFLNYGAPIHQWGGNKLGFLLSENRVDMPVFDSRSMTTMMRIPGGGHVVMLGGLTLEDEVTIQERIPILGITTKNEKKKNRRFLYLFLTAQKLETQGSERPEDNGTDR
ncbi:MAG: hypothetical protein KDM63_10670, partial [Verrucomicrobiae bacterium]|nr:hypothetical protein [Verrucomicrobiae bacterium]